MIQIVQGHEKFAYEGSKGSIEGIADWCDLQREEKVLLYSCPEKLVQKIGQQCVNVSILFNSWQRMEISEVQKFPKGIKSIYVEEVPQGALPVMQHPLSWLLS